MARIQIEDIGAGQFVITNGRDTLRVGSDWELPGVAETFGMVLRHKNGCPDRTGTDGSVDCPGCGQTAARFIRQAAGYLATCAEWGKRVADPGYFED